MSGASPAKGSPVLGEPASIIGLPAPSWYIAPSSGSALMSNGLPMSVVALK